MKEDEIVYVARMGIRKIKNYFWSKNLRRKKKYWQDQTVDVRIILKETLQKLGVMVWTGFNCLRIGSDGRLL